ncbi:hypothetical protein SBRY_100073 [Actinacidiphila bryophytorum]|uniref:Uncharacterized protein n=1 Tax=Actinacidiphila bryophytorum TaxID=1436133 RepID=A0A9W4ECZ9_9ACTN|nr:hypothetical protein SBRY_100073 [Actinacidiphila bryophytorum]
MPWRRGWRPPQVPPRPRPAGRVPRPRRTGARSEVFSWFSSSGEEGGRPGWSAGHTVLRWTATAASACTACAARGRRNRPSGAQVRPRDRRTGRRTAAERWSGDADGPVRPSAVATGIRHTDVARGYRRRGRMHCSSHGGLLHEVRGARCERSQPSVWGDCTETSCIPTAGLPQQWDTMRLTYTGDGTQESCSGPSASGRPAGPPGPQSPDRPGAPATGCRRSQRRSRPTVGNHPQAYGS